MYKVLIAGASGFVGRALIDRLLEDDSIEIVALSRNPQETSHPRVKWKTCDLFSLKDIREAFGNGVQTAYYLVHSMLPSANLAQGSFYDFDLILADNFVRAAREAKVQHLIYLGGMISSPEPVLSWHLKSRLEVEETLRASGIPLTTLRAGIIIGPNGSSFEILRRLVKRLPIMICPSWTQTKTQPVGLDDMVTVLHRTLTDTSVRGRVFDIGGRQAVSYYELIELTATALNRRPPLFTLSLIPLSLSRLWISIVTRFPKDLVYPLVLSLKHEMKVSPDRAWPYPEDLNAPLKKCIEGSVTPNPRPIRKRAVARGLNQVRSVQRFPLPDGKSAKWVVDEFFNWVPNQFPFLVRVRTTGNQCHFYVLNPAIRLLISERSPERSTDDRQLLYIRGGWLAKETKRGRLEFREVLNRRYILTAIHEYVPTLPWFLYRFTQAQVHVWVMNAFGRSISKRRKK